MIPFFFEQWKKAEDWMKSIAFPAIKSNLLSEKALEIKNYRVLCVDDDRSFCQFVKSLGETLHIETATAHTLEKAIFLIESSSKYDAFIIDGHLPDGVGFELIAWIREKKGWKHPIGFISHVYHDALTFKTLKEVFKVDYVLEKPIHPPEVKQLLIQLCQLRPSETSQHSLYHSILSDLKSSYEKSIPEKIECLERKILAVQRNPTPENLASLKFEVHKIGGSAATYGFAAVFETCKKIEFELMNHINLAKEGYIDPQWLLSLDRFYSEIKWHFQIKSSEKILKSLKPFSHLPFYYLIDDKIHQFEEETKDRLNVLIESLPSQAIEKLSSSDCFPQILILNAIYTTSSLSGYDILKAFYRKDDSLANTNTICLLVDQKNLQQQIEALKRGMTFILEKPFEPAFALSLLEQIPFRNLPFYFKILIIEDDEDISRYIQNTLKYAGMEIQVAHDFNQLERQIPGFNPDLVLVDVHLRNEFGMGILEWLRSVAKYKKLIIGMLSVSEEENYLIQKCYEYDVNDIVFKPLERGLIQRKVAHLLIKQGKQDLMKEIKNGKEMGSRVFKGFLKKLKKTYKTPFPKVMVIFEIDNFHSLKRKMQKLLIRLFFDEIEGLLKKYDMSAYLGRGHFALVFQGFHPHFVRLFIRSFLFDFISSIKKKSSSHLSYIIKGSLTTLSKDKGIEETIRYGKELIKHHASDNKKIEGDEGDNVYLVMDSSTPQGNSNEVWIFYEPSEQIEPFEKSLETSGFKVAFKTKWEDILGDNKFIPLLILTKRFIEKEEPAFLDRILKMNEGHIPVVSLSHNPTVEYLHELLERVNYYEFPFGLIIII